MKVRWSVASGRSLQPVGQMRGQKGQGMPAHRQWLLTGFGDLPLAQYAQVAIRASTLSRAARARSGKRSGRSREGAGVNHQ